jgi:hypothetical protein
MTEREELRVSVLIAMEQAREEIAQLATTDDDWHSSLRTAGGQHTLENAARCDEPRSNPAQRRTRRARTTKTERKIND